MKLKTMILALPAWLGLFGAVAMAKAPVPAHPEKINYPAFTYELPPASQFRAVLSNGLVVYIAEDRLFPTFDMSVSLRVGGAIDPEGKAGLAALMGEQIRDGGTKSLTPEELDEKLDFLAASARTSIGDTRGRSGLSCLSKDVDAALALWVEMMRYPRFDEDRLRLAKERRLQNIKRRNDSTNSIQGIEWGFLMNGEDHFSNRYPSSASISGITRDDLAAFHHRFIHPGNMVIAVAGDFDRAVMLKKLEQVFAGWPIGETGPTGFDAPTHKPKPGVYVLHKDDVNQGRVTIGHKSIVRGGPDEFALQVMQGILGATGFRSRLVARVRSNEGLAYNTGARYEQGVNYAGDFTAWFQSKSNSCAYATQIVLEEINRMRDEKVSQQDVDDAVAYVVESFPQRFPNKMAILRTYLADEHTGRDPKFWQSYVDNVKRVTPDDVLRVAKKYLHPDELVILAVGDASAMRAGGHDKAPDLRLDGFGKVTELPLRDPDTLTR